MIIERAWLRWPAMALVFVAATWLNLQLQPQLEGRAPLLPYFPSLVLVGLLCGLGPALMLLVLASLAILYFWIDPVGQFLPVTSLSDIELIALFVVSGLLVASVSAWARRLMQRERSGRRRLSLALAAGRMVTWDWNAQSGFTTTGGGAKEIFGQAWRSMDDMLAGMTPADAAKFQALFRYALASGGRFSQACPITRADNLEVVWAQIDGFVELDARGRAAHAYGASVDVTLQQEALRASQAAEERFQLALESGKVMAWECDAQARYTWAVNPPMGASREALIGAEVGAFAGQPAFADLVRHAIETGETAHLQQQVSRAGRERQFLTSLRPVRDEDDTVRRVIGATVDVTELSRTQEELRREARRKDAFLATLAHELRNPMAPIRYAVDILRRTDQPAARQRAVDTIARQSAHMTRLLDDLMDMSRITRNAVALQRDMIDLRDVVRHALEAVEPLYLEKRHRVTLSLPGRSVKVEGDPTRLQQVLGNLLDNAAKYSPVAGEVAVTLAIQDDQARITVRDQGLGIAPEMQPRLFELFTRVDASGSAPPGLGIGLAVSRQLVQLHGGALDVASEGLGHGSQFTIALPLAAEAIAHETAVTGNAGLQALGGRHDLPPSLPPDSGAGVGVGAGANLGVDNESDRISVLVVDDNVDAADTLADVLRAAHYRTAIAYHGNDALSAFERMQPRVVLLDIGLPGLTGNEVARRIRASSSDPDLVLIAITGWGQPADREETTAAGFDAHLVKPVEFSVLDRTIQQHLRAPAREEGRA